MENIELEDSHGVTLTASDSIAHNFPERNVTNDANDFKPTSKSFNKLTPKCPITFGKEIKILCITIHEALKITKH